MDDFLYCCNSGEEARIDLQLISRSFSRAAA